MDPALGLAANLPVPIQRLFRREADIFEPALMEEFSGTIGASRPYQPWNGVNQEANIYRLSRVFGTMPLDAIREL